MGFALFAAYWFISALKPAQIGEEKLVPAQPPEQWPREHTYIG